MDHNKFITLENNRAKRTIPIIEYEEKMGKYSEEWANSINIKVGENCPLEKQIRYIYFITRVYNDQDFLRYHEIKHYETPLKDFCDIEAIIVNSKGVFVGIRLNSTKKYLILGSNNSYTFREPDYVLSYFGVPSEYYNYDVEMLHYNEFHL